MKKQRSGLAGSHLAMSAVALFYGINYFTLKEVFNEGFNSFEILALRCLIATTFFVVFHRVAIREKVKDRKDYFRLMLCAFFGVALNQTFFLWGLSLTSPVNSAVLMVTAPIFVFVIATLLKQERITGAKVLGLVLAFGGAVGLILSKTGGGVNQASNPWGDLLITINAASYGMYLVLVRPLVVRYNTFTIIKWIFVFGSIPNVLIGSLFIEPEHFSNISGQALFGIAFLILFATIAAYFLNAWALKKVPSSAVSIYVYVQPVFVAILSSILGLETIDLLKILFILLIFAGVFMVTLWDNLRTPKQVV